MDTGQGCLDLRPILLGMVRISLRCRSCTFHIVCTRSCSRCWPAAPLHPRQIRELTRQTMRALPSMPRESTQPNPMRLPRATLSSTRCSRMDPIPNRMPQQPASPSDATWRKPAQRARPALCATIERAPSNASRPTRFFHAAREPGSATLRAAYASCQPQIAVSTHATPTQQSVAGPSVERARTVIRRTCAYQTDAVSAYQIDDRPHRRGRAKCTRVRSIYCQLRLSQSARPDAPRENF